MTDPPDRQPLTRNRRFVLVLTAGTISVLGNGFARVALAFGILALPGASPGRLSLILACQALPQLPFILAGGVVADRFSRSRVMVIADVVGFLAYAGLAAMVLSGQGQLAAMCALAALAGVATALFQPAVEGIVPQLVPRERLQQANGLLRMGRHSAMLAGLALSGVAVALLGAGWALALNAASFLVSAALIRGVRLPPRVRTHPSSGWADLTEGWREFASRQWLWAVVAQYSVVVAAINATVGVLGPMTAEEELGGARAWSVIVAAQALGMLAGAGFAARLRVRRPILVAVLCTLPAAVPIALLAGLAPVWVIAVSMFLSGVTADVFGVLWSTTLQREIPEEALSRVVSYDMLGSLAFAPLGLLVAGPTAAVIGTGATLAACSGLVAVATLLTLLSPQVRSLRTRDSVVQRHPASRAEPAPPATEAR